MEKDLAKDQYTERGKIIKYKDWDEEQKQSSDDDTTAQSFNIREPNKSQRNCEEDVSQSHQKIVLLILQEVETNRENMARDK